MPRSLKDGPMATWSGDERKSAFQSDQPAPDGTHARAKPRTEPNVTAAEMRDVEDGVSSAPFSMITKQTVFVLGAGASEPYGFPLGGRLVREAITRLTRSRDPIHEMLQRVCGCTITRLQEFASALERSASPSIDVFLEGRPDFLDIGKAVIAGVLIPYENEIELFTRYEASLVDENLRRARRWYDYLLNRMTTGKPEDFTENKLSILTFNYDRSLEHFLLVALQNRYNIGPTQAAQFLAAIPIIHLHGQLGQLGEKLDLDAGMRPYDGAIAPATIKLAAAGISVVHEDIGHYPQFTRANDLLRAADQIWILGFGYLERNIKRLGEHAFNRPDGRSLTLWGTAYGLGHAERAMVVNLVTDGIAPGLSAGERDWDALTLLRERWFA